MGLVIRARAPTKSASCNQSFECIGVSLELLRPQHGHQQVGEQQQRRDCYKKVFHLVLLEFLAETDVKGTDEKEQEYESYKNHVAHGDKVVP